jgi:hypothetical protein
MRGHGGPYGHEMLRLPHFLDNRFTDGGQPYMLTTIYPLGKYLVLISVRGEMSQGL